MQPASRHTKLDHTLDEEFTEGDRFGREGNNLHTKRRRQRDAKTLRNQQQKSTSSPPHSVVVRQPCTKPGLQSQPGMRCRSWAERLDFDTTTWARIKDAMRVVFLGNLAHLLQGMTNQTTPSLRQWLVCDSVGRWFTTQ